MAQDALYWQTGLDLNFEGADASTTFTDISPTPKTPTVFADAQIDTAQFKTGAASLLLDGTGDYLSYPSHADFDFGTGDFCVELWWRPGNVTTTYMMVSQILKATSGSTTELSFYIGQSTTGKAFGAVAVAGVSTVVTGTSSAVIGTWRHIALVRSATVLTIYVDGVAEHTAAAAGAINTYAGRTLHIGYYNNTNPYIPNGHIDGIRITKGNPRYTASFAPSLELFEVTPAGTGDANLSAPMGGIVAKSGATASGSAPMGVMTALGGSYATLIGTIGRLSAAGHDSTGERQFSGSAPMGTLAARAGARASVSAPMGTPLASITVPISVRAELVGPMGDLVASGTVATSVRADLRLTSAGTVEAHSGGRAVIEGPMGTLNAVATAGILARFANSAPMGSLHALMTTGIVVRAELVAPMLDRSPSARATLVAPMGYITAIGRAVIAVTYEAYAVNLKPGEGMPHQVTRYTNYPFNQIVRFQGNYYGVASDGLYLLGGDTDYHAVTPTGPSWAVKTAITDFGSSKNKVTRETFLGARLGPTVSASVSIGEAANVTYAAQIVRGTKAQNHRVKFGKGLEARYWSFGLSDTAGSDVDIDTLEFDARETGRKL